MNKYTVFCFCFFCGSSMNPSNNAINLFYCAVAVSTDWTRMLCGLFCLCIERCTYADARRKTMNNKNENPFYRNRFWLWYYFIHTQLTILLNDFIPHFRRLQTKMKRTKSIRSNDRLLHHHKTPDTPVSHTIVDVNKECE